MRVKLTDFVLFWKVKNVKNKNTLGEWKVFVDTKRIKYDDLKRGMG